MQLLLCPRLPQKLKQTRLLGLHFIHYMFCLISSYHNLPDNSPVMWRKGEHEFLSNLFSLCLIIRYQDDHIWLLMKFMKLIKNRKQTGLKKQLSTRTLTYVQLLNVIRYVSKHCYKFKPNQIMASTNLIRDGHLSLDIVQIRQTKLSPLI